MMLSQLTVCYEGQEQEWNRYESLALFFTVGEGIVVWLDARCFLSPLLLTQLLECGSSCGFKYPLQHLCWRMTVATGNGLTTKLTALLVDRVIISASARGQTSPLQCEVHANFFFLVWLEQWVVHFFHRKNCEVPFLHKHSVMSVGICVTEWPEKWCIGSLHPLTIVKLCRTVYPAQYSPGLVHSMCKTFVIKRHHTTHLTSTIEHNFNALKMKLQVFKLWINVKCWHKEENFLFMNKYIVFI